MSIMGPKGSGYRNNRRGGSAVVGVFLLLVCLFWLGAIIVSGVRSGYTWENKYHSNWTLADKSSSIPAKAELVNAFVASMESNRHDFADNDAIFLTTPDNSFDNNIKALKTLQVRLKDIEKMDPTSFQYNTAIQQITAQEQGEAHQMIGVLQGCYNLKNYKMAWKWIQVTNVLLMLILLVIACILLGIDL